MPHISHTVPAAAGGGAPTGTAGGELAGTYPNPTVADAVIDDANVVAGGLTNAALAAAAGIVNTKLATNPLARANHTGTQLMATISDAGSLATKSTVASADITDGTIVTGDLSATAGITSGQLAGSIAPSKVTGTAVVQTDTVNTLTAPAADFSMNTHKITNLTNGSGAQDAAAFGQIPVAGTVGGPAKWVIRTADSSTITASATPLNDDTLLFAVGASDRWFIEAFLIFTGAAGSGTVATEDVKLGWSVPASGAMQWGALGAGTNLLAGFGGTSAANAPAVVLTAAGTLSEGMATGSIGLSLAGFYTGGGTSGNVNLQWSQDVSNGATLLIAKNSALRVTRIA